MKTIIGDSAGALQQAAAHLQALVAKKPEAVLALAGGRTMARLWAELVRLYEAGALRLDRVRVFTVAEYEGAPRGAHLPPGPGGGAAGQNGPAAGKLPFPLAGDS